MKPVAMIVVLAGIGACGVDNLAEDESYGQVSSALVSNERVSNAVVVEWNDNADKAIGTAAVSPPRRARAHAIVAVAVHDALNGVRQKFTRYASTAVDRKASPEAAAAQAAHDALVGLFPAQQAELDAKLAATLAALTVSEEQKARGTALGAAAAAAVLAARATDGFDATISYTPTMQPGFWRPVPPATLPALEPHWGNVVPFGLTSGDQFRAPPPYPLGSRKYAADVNEIQAVGAKESTTRTPDETHAAHFWYEPSAHGWNRLARIALGLEPQNIYKTARLFALMHTAMSDGYVASFNDKYFYQNWRPITAIREADTDGNPATIEDTAWDSLRPAPNMPDHTSGHAVVGAAASVALEKIFGRGVGAPIKMTSTTATPPETTRSWHTFHQAVLENADSRVKVGIHFRKACDDGVAQGLKVGRYVVRHLFVRDRDCDHDDD